MRDLHSWCTTLLTGAADVTPHHTCDIDVHPVTALAEVRVERHYIDLDADDAGTLAIALLYEGDRVCSFAILGRNDDALLLRLSTGETYDLEGDLSQAQLVNILAGVCNPPQQHLDIKIFSRKADPVLAAIETIDDLFYDHYRGETDLRELLSPLIQHHTGPDCCQDIDGTYARTGGFSARCFPL